jgi:hypothetical protein
MMIRQRRGKDAEYYDPTLEVETSSRPTRSTTDNNKPRQKKDIDFLSKSALYFLQQRQQRVVPGLVLLLLLFLFRIFFYFVQVREESNTTNIHPYQFDIPPIQHASDTYHVLACPLEPPPEYPREYPILTVLNNWNPKDIDNPPRHVYQGICIFDVSSASSTMEQERIHHQIQAYQTAEVPFVVRNHPDVVTAVEKWNHPHYLESKLHGHHFLATLSNTTDVTYFSMNSNYTVVPPDFVPPTTTAPMTFDEWIQQQAEDEHGNTHHHQDRNYNYKYAYLRLDACLEGRTKCDSTYQGDPTLDPADFIYEDLSFFHPHHTTTTQTIPFPTINASHTRGIQCRFASPGLTAANHFDNERNFLSLLRGERRYLLGHPRNCPTMYLYPPKHPYERHTQVDWTAIAEEEEASSRVRQQQEQFPDFANTTINEIVLHAGDILYLPTYWFHHIISLTVNVQCNTRSGYSVEYDQLIYDCGFFYDFPE